MDSVVTLTSKTTPSKTGDESLSPFGNARSTINDKPLSKDELEKYTEYFHATLYLCLGKPATRFWYLPELIRFVGMIYLKENPLLKEPLKVEHFKRRLLGHWGSDAGQSFTYLHFNRLIKKYDIDALFVSGPG